ncbi:rifampin resistance protein [Nile crocodilepox virus]|uniref:62 kDa protein n=1 Tax=Nile crocodilepox virus (isolate Crocodylus niloticus/Zimbabwe/Ume/2001) TaxID=1289473 RepID=Q070D1_CPRVZ|nr:rifampin resistance protein [Nile crocodilepox virus]ABJ09011.1 rifampin resistance protein [Nile crocodilepox virus]
MNTSIVNSFLGSRRAEAAKSKNVFGVDPQETTYYMPQYITVSGIRCDDVVRYEVKDQYINAANYFVLTVPLPEIKGVGSFAYAPHVGYKCIKRVQFSSQRGLIWEIEGEELFAASRGSNIAACSGYSEKLCSMSTGHTPNDVIKESELIYVYLRTPFDDESTISSLKIPANDKIVIEVAFNRISDVVIYDAAFNIDAFAHGFVYQPDLSFIGYTVKGLQAKPAYLQIPRRVVGSLNITSNSLGEVYSITSLSVYVKPCYGIENKFIAYPGFDQTPAAYVKAYVERLLFDLLTVSAERPSNFPPESDIVRIASSDIVTIQDIDVSVCIDGVPAGKSLYFHRNLLVFGTRRNGAAYNISKKFSKICGFYNDVNDTIIYTEVLHTVDMLDVSIPVKLWNSERNIQAGDNRSAASKAKDVYINDPFLKGIDLLGSFDPVERMEVRFGHELMYSEDFPISRIYNRLLTSAIAAERKLIFNYTQCCLFKPTILQADHSRGKDKLHVKVGYKRLDVDNPIHYVDRQLVLACNDLYRISYDNSEVKVSKIND